MLCKNRYIDIHLLNLSHSTQFHSSFPISLLTTSSIFISFLNQVFWTSLSLSFTLAKHYRYMNHEERYWQRRQMANSGCTRTVIHAEVDLGVRDRPYRASIQWREPHTRAPPTRQQHSSHVMHMHVSCGHGRHVALGCIVCRYWLCFVCLHAWIRASEYRLFLPLYVCGVVGGGFMTAHLFQAQRQWFTQRCTQWVDSIHTGLHTRSEYNTPTRKATVDVLLTPSSSPV